jgi:glycosyltransferase involved in cell wall biosynthesis
MHQYTADLANRVAAGHRVSLVTTTSLPLDRYSSDVRVYTPLTTTNTGLSMEGLRLGAVGRVWEQVNALQPDLIHFTGPHLWNAFLAWRFKAQGVPTIHTLHDLDPHRGTHFKTLLQVWNAFIIRSVNHILVHGECYRDRLLHRGLSPKKVSYTPLLHLFLSYEKNLTLANLEMSEMLPEPVYEPFILFFGRLERYKGIDHLLTAFAELTSLAGKDEEKAAGVPRLVLAGPGNLADLWAGDVPRGVTVCDDFINDEAALDLFHRCSLLVLPYVDATQSALIPAAYFFRKPVVASRAGALTEYVEDGLTGFVVEPDHPPSLARTLAAALSDRQRLRLMGEAGFEWYRQRRREETAALMRLYSQVARERKIRPHSGPAEENVPGGVNV